MPFPVYPTYFADPFVFQHEGSYFAVGTGLVEAAGAADRHSEALTVGGKPGVFQLLESGDLQSWRPVAAALESLHPDYGDSYWAPEVAVAGGRFYLYYSVGRGDRMHHLRVAVSERPEGPYRDTGVTLTDPYRIPFAIDASPFQDGDGQWYLFYARDFVDTAGGCRAGTALVLDRLDGMMKLAGEERVVLRARHDWQRFMQNRVIYGGTYDWHTLEGPCVRKHDGRYYCLFSAGRWENETYGVDYCVADQVFGPYSGESATGARLLHTLPGELIGPGHNSIATGRDGRDYIVYHAWDPAMTARRMFIDPVEWSSSGPRITGG